jgi:hypothetical protein
MDKMRCATGCCQTTGCRVSPVLTHCIDFAARLYHAVLCCAVLCHAVLQVFSTGSRVLNLFGYTGGFSVYAGLAGAASVTTVDVADAALAAAGRRAGVVCCCVTMCVFGTICVGNCGAPYHMPRLDLLMRYFPANSPGA